MKVSTKHMAAKAAQVTKNPTMLVKVSYKKDEYVKCFTLTGKLHFACWINYLNTKHHLPNFFVKYVVMVTIIGFVFFYENVMKP